MQVLIGLLAAAATFYYTGKLWLAPTNVIDDPALDTLFWQIPFALHRNPALTVIGIALVWGAIMATIYLYADQHRDSKLEIEYGAVGIGISIPIAAIVLDAALKGWMVDFPGVQHFQFVGAAFCGIPYSLAFLVAPPILAIFAVPAVLTAIVRMLRGTPNPVVFLGDISTTSS